MYAVLGWVNIAAIVVMTAPLWLRLISKYSFKNKNKALLRFIKALRTVHKPLGLALVASVIVHGFLALGALRLHTGTIAGIMLIVTAALGGTFFRLKKKPVLIAHRISASLLTLLVLVHLIFPSALWQLFGI
jgi:hypothetical protein